MREKKISTPYFIAYAKNIEGFWIKIGAAWKSKNQNGKEYISLSIDSLPLRFDGKITLHLNDREASP